MADPIPWTSDQMMRLAARGMVKVDLLGHRGTTLVTCEEVAAMAAVLALSGAIAPEFLTPENLKGTPNGK